MDIKEKVKELPVSSGVYIMKSKEGKILYIGKASSLKSRVSSYFSGSKSIKTDLLMERVADIEHIECVSSEQALVLEAALIKEKKPKYNISLRDNKSYPYVEVTNEKFPRIYISRPKNKTKSIFFGPYPKTKPLRSALKLIRKIFPYSSCKGYPKKACLFFHLSLCPAPCSGRVSALKYQENIKSICKILKGERKKLRVDLKKKMDFLASKSKFEEAAGVRDKLLALERLYSGKPEVHELVSLKEVLNLRQLPLAIEAIDISSLARSESVGSVVVFCDGVSDKSKYRRFLIKKADKRDDYAMIQEVVTRRYKRLIGEKQKLPNLIIIDGGFGHVARAKQTLNTLDVKIPVIGIAKKNEEVWFPFQNSSLLIPKNSPALHLIQRLRDEAHRFAHSYQLVRRKKKQYGLSKRKKHD